MSGAGDWALRVFGLCYILHTVPVEVRETGVLSQDRGTWEPSTGDMCPGVLEVLRLGVARGGHKPIFTIQALTCL